jgi:hypothetical protein
MKKVRSGAAVLLAAAALTSLSACGNTSSKSASAQPASPGSPSATTTTLPSITRRAVPTPSQASTSLSSVKPNPVNFGQDACRDFDSLVGYLAGMPEDGPDAAGQVGGFVVDATQAVDASGGGARWVKLDNDLKALEAVANSKQWPETTAAARLPQTKVVETDCASIGAG